MLDTSKSVKRLAMEIRGKSRIAAENHLVRYGASVSSAAAAVAMCIGHKSATVIGDLDFIAQSIDINC